MAHLDEKKLTLQVAEHYCDLLDNHRDHLALYLSHSVVLDWFGRTIAGKDHVTSFVLREMVETKHKLTSVEPTGPIIHRGKVELLTMDTSPVNDLAQPLPTSEQELSNSQEKSILSLKGLAVEDDTNRIIPVFRKGRKYPKVPFQTIGDVKTSLIGDGGQHFNASLSCKIEEGQGDCIPNVHPNDSHRFFEGRGSVEFCRTKQSPSTSRNLKLVADTMKWERHCKIHVAYSVPSIWDSVTKDYEIELMIYDDNVRCRRNLAAEFDKLS